ncbi:hypothetical protein ACMGDH_08810 [Sphingomonas sp. DT-207]|uniref:hypothetical protein n=1 Tax=Sphingomonas sp. DT-207 TaxID=3396167 RepID=UPI003F1C15F3
MSIAILFAPITLIAADLPPADPTAAAAYATQARNRGGGGRASAGGRPVRNKSHTSVNHANRSGNVNRGTVSRNTVNRNANVNVNRNANVNVNRNVNVHGGGYYGHGCYGCDWDDDHDFAVGAAVGLATGAVIGAAANSNNNTTVVVSPGTVVTGLPGGCSATIVGNVTYQRCGSVWYQPQYMGSSVQYVVVNPPM